MKPTSTFGQHARAVADLEAENARLQEQVKEAEGERDDFRSRLKLEQASFRNCDRFLVAASRERDRYKARDKLRGVAGDSLAAECANVDASLNERARAVRRWNEVAALTPEEAREKEWTRRVDGLELHIRRS